MMRKLRRTLAAVALVISSSAFVAAQAYTVPRRLALERAAKRTFPKWWRTAIGYEGLIPQRFFPIGWSRDGKFAYYYEPVDEACGCYFANLVIQDMRTDNVLYEFKYRQDDLMDDKGNMPPEDNIAKLWKKNAALFDEKLAEHKIVARPSVLLGKTFTVAGRTYAAKAVKRMGKNPDGDERVDKLTFTLTSPRLGTKTLTTIDHREEEYWYTLDGGVIGVIKSRFEDRVAVIGMEVNRGWEGPPHNGDIVVTGADLTSGFSAR